MNLRKNQKIQNFRAKVGCIIRLPNFFYLRKNRGENSKDNRKFNQKGKEAVLKKSSII